MAFNGNIPQQYCYGCLKSYCTLYEFVLHVDQFLVHILCSKTRYFRPCGLQLKFSEFPWPAPPYRHRTWRHLRHWMHASISLASTTTHSDLTRRCFHGVASQHLLTLVSVILQGISSSARLLQFIAIDRRPSRKVTRGRLQLHSVSLVAMDGSGSQKT